LFLELRKLIFIVIDDLIHVEVSKRMVKMAKLLGWLVTPQKNVSWVHQVHSKPSRAEQSRLLSPRAIYSIWGLQLRESVVFIAGDSWLISQLET
jgi:hypothetical protein